MLEKKLIFLTEHALEESHVSLFLRALRKKYALSVWDYFDFFSSKKWQVEDSQKLVFALNAERADVLVINLGHWRPFSKKLIENVSRSVKVVLVFPDLEHTHLMDAYLLGLDNVTYWVLGVSAYSYVSEQQCFGWGQPLLDELRDFNTSPTIDFLFAGGSERADRPQFLSAARDFCAANGYTFFEWTPTPDHSLSLRELSQLMNRSRFVLNFSKVQADISHQIEVSTRQFKGRVGETLGSGSVLVTEIFPGIEQIFPCYNEFSFDTVEEFSDLLERFARMDEVCRQTLFDLQRESAKTFTLDSWSDHFFAIVESCTEGPSVKNSFPKVESDNLFEYAFFADRYKQTKFYWAGYAKNGFLFKLKFLIREFPLFILQLGLLKFFVKGIYFGYLHKK